MRKKTEVRREEIKAAVLEIIAHNGFSQLSTRNVASKVGLSEGAIFRHYKTKRDIILDIMEDVKNNLQDALRKTALSAEPASKRFQNFLHTHLEYLNQHQGITILLFSEAAYMNDSTLKLQLNQILTEQKLLIAKIIHDGKQEGIWNTDLDEDEMATLYLGIPLSFNIEFVLNKKNIDTAKFCDTMYRLLSRVLTA